LPIDVKSLHCLAVASRTVTRRSFALRRIAPIREFPEVFFKSPVKRGPKKGFSQILSPRLSLARCNLAGLRWVLGPLKTRGRAGAEAL